MDTFFCNGFEYMVNYTCDYLNNQEINLGLTIKISLRTPFWK